MSVSLLYKVNEELLKYVCERDLASAGCLVSVDRNTIAMSLRQMDTLHIHEHGACWDCLGVNEGDKLITRIQKEIGISSRKSEWVRIFILF